jgi:uncharacterized protein (TIGR02996 family)
VTSGDALYEAILANPADDLPRLVYADWLEEHGDAERSEFIRAQIGGDHVRADPLLDRNRAKWWIPRLRGGQTFARGFVDEVWATAEDIIAHADLLLRYPLRGLRITAATDQIESLAGLPILARVTRLDLSNNTGVHNRFDRLFYNGGLRNLTSLTLRNVRVWGDDLPRWPMIPGFPKLTHLDLSGNPIGDDGLGVLAEHPGFASVRALILRGDGQESYDLIGDEGLIRLVRSPIAAGLVQLDLTDNDVSDIGIEALAASAEFSQLKELFLSVRRMELRGARALARWSRLETIETVDLSSTPIYEPAHELLKASLFPDKFVLPRLVWDSIST